MRYFTGSIFKLAGTLYSMNSTRILTNQFTKVPQPSKRESIRGSLLGEELCDYGRRFVL